VLRCISIARHVFVHQRLKSYLVAIVDATRTRSESRLGASPRAGLQLLRAAKARAAMAGRTYVIPEDISSLAVPSLAHRILLTTQAHLGGSTSSGLVQTAVDSIPVATGRR
jgi:MoxR-like ATPase